MEMAKGEEWACGILQGTLPLNGFVISIVIARHP